MILIGDSVTWQIARTLQWMAQHNPHLARLRIVPCMMSIIPRRKEAIDAAVRDCVARGDVSGGSTSAQTPRRAIVVNVGLWYQPTPWCAPAHMQQSPGCTCCRHAALNETHPDSTPRPAGYTWDGGQVYSEMRRFSGTSTIADYARDVKLLAAVLKRWQATGFTVLWLAAPPQHFPPKGPYDVAELQIPSLDEQPQNHREGRPSFTGSCLSEVSAAPQMRNDVALPIVHGAGLPAVNLWQALRGRGDLHRGHDCTHWCEPGDAMWFTANAVLGSVAVLSEPGFAAGLVHLT